ncbi:MAG: type II CAAX endopeptidase family protein [Verrucomicrobiota bacterium]
METPPVDAPLVIASLLILGILLGSAVLWIRQVQKPRDLILPNQGVSPWAIGWVNFGIFICAIVIGVFAMQQIGITFLLDSEAEGPFEMTPWLAVASVILLQGPMVAVYYLARRFYPSHYAGRMSRSKLTFSGSFKKALPLFIMLLPVIWIATLLWTNVLAGLQTAGVIEEINQQELITLFKDGGDLLAIIILVLMAIIVAPIVEEIIFRGCIYRFLKSQTTILPAQALSGAVFALMHANLLSFVPLVIVGILLARIYEKTGSLTVAIWFHAFFNAFSLSMLFITGMSEALPTDY